MKIPWLAAVIVCAGCASSSESRRPLPRNAPSDADRAVGELAAPEDKEAGPPGPAESRPEPHGSIAGFFQTHFSSDAWRDYVVDAYLTKPPVIEPLALGAAAAIVAPWDKPAQHGISHTLGHTPEIGDYAQYAVIAESVLAGIFDPGEGRTAYDETWMQAEAFALSIGTEVGLKAVVGRSRPNGSSSRASFPSGHSTAAFTAAALVEKNSGPWLGVPAYMLAALTAYSRVEADAHFVSDVLAGAAIGVFWAEVMDALHFGTDYGGPGIAGHRPTLGVSTAPGGGYEVFLEFGF